MKPPYPNLSKRVKKGMRHEFSKYLRIRGGVIVRNHKDEPEFALMNMMTFHRDYEPPNWDTKGMREATK